MARTFVAVELIGLALSDQRFLEFRHMVGGGEPVIVTEETEQRAAERRRLVDQSDHLEGESLRDGPGDERPVAVDGGVDRKAHRGEEGLATTRAVADDTDLSVGVGERT